MTTDNIPNVTGRRFVQRSKIVSLWRLAGNVARVEATMYGRVSRISSSRNGTRHPMTLRMDSPNAETHSKQLKMENNAKNNIL